jgi:hypothetical protein
LGEKTRGKNTKKHEKHEKTSPKKCIPIGEADADVKGC